MQLEEKCFPLIPTPELPWTPSCFFWQLLVHPSRFRWVSSGTQSLYVLFVLELYAYPKVNTTTLLSFSLSSLTLEEEKVTLILQVLVLMRTLCLPLCMNMEPIFSFLLGPSKLYSYPIYKLATQLDCRCFKSRDTEFVKLCPPELV